MTPDAKALLARYKPKEGKPVTPGCQLNSVRFSPCGKMFAAGDFEGRVLRWDASGDGLASLAGHHGWVQGLAFHPDRKRLFTADSWGRLCCWPYGEKAPKPLWEVAKAHEGWARQLAVSADGKWLASCGRDGAVRLWSPDKGEKLREFTAHGRDVFAVAFHPDSKSVVSGDEKGLIKRWDPATGKALGEYDAKETYLYDRIQDVPGLRCLAFDPKGETLACGGGQPTTGGFVQGSPLVVLFDAATGKRKQALKVGANADGFVYDLHWHAGGFLMAVTSGQPGRGQLLFLRPGDDKPFFTAPMPNCHSLAVHPEGRRLVVAATNANSAGNGRRLGKDKEYPGNFSPLRVWDLPKE